MFQLTQPNVSCFVSISTPGSGVEADPLAVVLCPGSSIPSSGLSCGLRVVAEPVSAVLPGSCHAASLMALIGLLLTSSWIHLLIIDTCISKHSVYLPTLSNVLSLRCTHGIYCMSVRPGRGIPPLLLSLRFLPCSPLNCGVFLWKCFLVRCEGLRTEGVVWKYSATYSPGICTTAFPAVSCEQTR